jgi:hypothetical protein
MKAYLQHGPWGGPHTKTEEVEVRETEHLPRKGQTRGGYGNRLPTHYQVRWNKRWYRVLCFCWSNNGTTYIRAKDVPDGIVVRIDQE